MSIFCPSTVHSFDHVDDRIKELLTGWNRLIEMRWSAVVAAVVVLVSVCSDSPDAQGMSRVAPTIVERSTVPDVSTTSITKSSTTAPLSRGVGRSESITEFVRINEGRIRVSHPEEIDVHCCDVEGIQDIDPEFLGPCEPRPSLSIRDTDRWGEVVRLSVALFWGDEGGHIVILDLRDTAEGPQVVNALAEDTAPGIHGGLEDSLPTRIEFQDWGPPRLASGIVLTTTQDGSTESQEFWAVNEKDFPPTGC